MSRIADVFKKKKTFVGYLTAGDGGLEAGLKAAAALLDGGVDILELGVPFSDPVADGPVIQRAMQRALSDRVTPGRVLELARKIRAQSDAPLVLFSYCNPVLAGGKTFYARCKDAGIDGILLVDLPPEEAADHLRLCRENGLDPILLVTPSTSDERLRRIAEQGSGFLYYVCHKGTTGARATLPPGLEKDFERIRKFSNLPVVAGFGIGDRETAAHVLRHADGFVTGSAFLNEWEKTSDAEKLRRLAQSIDPRV